MANILIVDDRAENRDFLVTLLGYRGHTLRQASDGAEALEAVRAQAPDLVISDVLMPTMDGYEFVHRLRADPQLAAIPVVFYTAHYLQREATLLAEKSGVRHILRKPCEPREVLSVVAAALGEEAAPPPPAPSIEALSGEHLQLLMEQVSKKNEQLRFATLRLSALLEVCRKLGYERDPKRLVERYAVAAREIVGARQAGIRILGLSGPDQIATSGLDDAGVARLSWGETGGPAEASLTVPVATPSQTYGWLWLTEKLGQIEFEEEDTTAALALAGQLAVAYENASLYAELRGRSEKTDERLRLEKELLAEVYAAQEGVHAAARKLNARIGRTGALLDQLVKQPTSLAGKGTEPAGPTEMPDGQPGARGSDLLNLSSAEASQYAAHTGDYAADTEDVRFGTR